eukprot:TRINITY_DN789_c0_g1_i2.p1 TRINITY_DN789_c0_g1~~TRINITY_DN789_c0_g1_i2.p1  ORF type:complete len:296 (+),score=64.18 TRINITY_DN789_c0_g1_i2:46-933(+)
MASVASAASTAVSQIVCPVDFALRSRVSECSIQTTSAFPFAVRHRAISRSRSSKTVRKHFLSSTVRATAEAETAVPSSVEAPADDGNWVPVIPVEALPRGERRLVRQDGQEILLLWYRGEIFAIENSSPSEGAYAEGFLNAKLTQDGCIVCPTSSTTYDLKTGAIRDWYPTNPVLRFLTRPIRDLNVYAVKLDNFQICVNMGGGAASGVAAEVMFGQSRVGQTADDVAVDEVRMIIDESEEGFGFTRKNELINGRAAMAGFFMLLIIELVTGKGLLGVTGFLDFLYRTLLPGPIL